MRRSISINRKSPRRATGFTIMELMITVALAALLLGFGIPSFRNIIANNRLISQTNEFIGGVGHSPNPQNRGFLLIILGIAHQRNNR